MTSVHFTRAFIQRGGIEPRRPMSQLGFLRGLGRRERYPTSFQKPALYDVRQPVPSWRTGSWPKVEYFGRLTQGRSAHVKGEFDLPTILLGTTPVRERGRSALVSLRDSTRSQPNVAASSPATHETLQGTDGYLSRWPSTDDQRPLKRGPKSTRATPVASAHKLAATQS